MQLLRDNLTLWTSDMQVRVRPAQHASHSACGTEHQQGWGAKGASLLRNG